MNWIPGALDRGGRGPGIQGFRDPLDPWPKGSSDPWIPKAHVRACTRSGFVWWPADEAAHTRCNAMFARTTSCCNSLHLFNDPEQNALQIYDALHKIPVQHAARFTMCLAVLFRNCHLIHCANKNMPLRVFGPFGLFKPPVPQLHHFSGRLAAIIRMRLRVPRPSNIFKPLGAAADLT